MNRRGFLGATVGVASAALAGCFGGVETEPLSIPPVLEDRPGGVYYPTHLEGMASVESGDAGPFRVGVSYSYPHRFWTVSGTSVSRTSIRNADDVHLMATVWNPETGTVIPEAGVSVEITTDGDLVTQEVLYPMLSQVMGVHYGANFDLERGDGEYEVTVSIGGLSIRRTGAFEGRFGDPAETTVSFQYSETKTRDITLERTPDRAGTAAAAEPMSMGGMPIGLAPSRGALPGRFLGAKRVDDAVLTTIALEDADRFGAGADEGYLAVSTRTPYNGLTIPAMGLVATVTRDGDRIADGPLTRTLDPDVGYHYGAVVPSIEAGDRVAIAVDTPAQVARHEGYETAFLDLGSVEYVA
jgi:uncharacterized protein involved in high-affinity Fe2+ transport